VLGSQAHAVLLEAAVQVDGPEIARQGRGAGPTRREPRQGPDRVAARDHQGLAGEVSQGISADQEAGGLAVLPRPAALFEQVGQVAWPGVEGGDAGPVDHEQLAKAVGRIEDGDDGLDPFGRERQVKQVQSALRGEGRNHVPLPRTP